MAKEAADKAEAERLAKEEADKQEAERLAKHQAALEEAVRVAKEQAHKEEAERLAKEAADKAEAERLAKEAADKAEAERLAKHQAALEEAVRVAKEQAHKEEADRVVKKRSAMVEASTSTKHLEIWWKEKDLALDAEHSDQQQAYQRVAPVLSSLPAAGDTALRAFAHVHSSGKGDGACFEKHRVEQKVWSGILEAVALAKAVLTNPKDGHDFRHMQWLKRLVTKCALLQQIQKSQSPQQVRVNEPSSSRLHLDDIKHVLTDVQHQSDQSALLLNSLSERIATTNTPQTRRQFVVDLVDVDILALNVVGKAGARDKKAQTAVKAVGMFRTLLLSSGTNARCATAACVRLMHGLCSTPEGRSYVRSHDLALQLLVRALLRRQKDVRKATRGRILSILQTLSLNASSGRTMLAVSLKKESESGANALSETQNVSDDNLCKTLLELLASEVKTAGEMAEEYLKVQTDQLGAAALIRDSPDRAVDHWRQLQLIEGRADRMHSLDYTLALVVNLLHASLPGWRPSAQTVWLAPMLNGLASLVCCCGTLWPGTHTRMARIALRLVFHGAAQEDAEKLMLALREVGGCM